MNDGPTYLGMYYVGIWGKYQIRYRIQISVPRRPLPCSPWTDTETFRQYQ